MLHLVGLSTQNGSVFSSNCPLVHESLTMTVSTARGQNSDRFSALKAWRGFSLLQNVKTTSRTRPLPGSLHPSVQRVPGFFHGCKATGAWSNHSLLPSTEFKNEWVYKSSLPHAFMAWKGKFYFFIYILCMCACVWYLCDILKQSLSSCNLHVQTNRSSRVSYLEAQSENEVSEREAGLVSVPHEMAAPSHFWHRAPGCIAPRTGVLHIYSFSGLIYY